MEKKKKILYIDDDAFMQVFFEGYFSTYFAVLVKNTAEEAWSVLTSGYRPDAIILDLNLPKKSGGELLQALKKHSALRHIPTIVLSANNDSTTRINMLKEGAVDYLCKPFNPEELLVRLEKLLPARQAATAPEKKSPNGKHWRKRAFDVVFSATLLLLLSPVLLLIALLIKIESKGPVLYISKRIGKNYKTFDFYKFRSMYQNADQLVHKLKAQNQYARGKAVQELAPVCGVCAKSHKALLATNGKWVCEHYLQAKSEAEGTFLKVENDPRVSRLGAFLRKTSLDELPQLFNVLKGDMSLVGNRPLPPYEAEHLTSDEAVARFKAPAGITGLWQVTKRGKKEMSAQERIDLDNQYALQYSFRKDLLILLKTIPALLQKEAV